LSLRAPLAPSYGTLLEVYSLGNPDLRPERSKEFEGGVDATLLEQRLQLGLTWYRRSTTDLIATQILPSGLDDGNARNIALVRGSGVEAQLTTTLVDTRPLSLAFTFGHSKNGTVLVRLGTSQRNAEVWGGFKEGYPLGVRFAQRYVSFSDINGNGVLEGGTPEVVQSDTAEFAGLVQAPIQQTLTLNAGLLDKKLRLSATFSREKGGTGTIGYDCKQCRGAYDPHSSLEEQAQNIMNLYPGPVDFTRLREITAAVTLPSAVTRALHVSTSTIALSARNLALWTSFRGLDPESRPLVGNMATTDVLGAIGIPQSRTWTVRFDLGL
jgi:hypothetical protein